MRVAIVGVVLAVFGTAGPASAQEPINVAVQVTELWRIFKDLYGASGLVVNSNVPLASGAGAAQLWEKLVQAAQALQAEQVPYDPVGRGANWALMETMRRCGVKATLPPKRWAPGVTLASPVWHPPSSAHAASSSGPAAAKIAPHTPPPRRSAVLAAFTIASIRSVVMSSVTTVRVTAGVNHIATRECRGSPTGAPAPKLAPLT